MNLSDFLNGTFTHPSFPEPEHAGVAATLADALARLLGDRDIQWDRDTVGRMAALGAFELFDTGDTDGFTHLLYLEMLRLTARRSPVAARLIAAHHHTVLMGARPEDDRVGLTAWEGRLEMVDFRDGNFLVSGTVISDVDPRLADYLVFPAKRANCFLRIHDPGQAFDVTPLRNPDGETRYRVHLVNIGIEPRDVFTCDATWLRTKELLDFGAQRIGILDRAIDLAESFADERELFRKKLSENTYITGRHHQYRVEQTRCWSAWLHTAALVRDSRAGDDLPFLAYHLGRTGLDAVSQLMQLCGGTGYMQEFGMPRLYQRMMYLVELYRPPVALCDADLEPPAPADPDAVVGPCPADTEQLRRLSLHALAGRRPNICNRALDQVLTLYTTATMTWHGAFLADLDEPETARAHDHHLRAAMAGLEVV